MANVGSGTSRVIIDPDGEAATVTGGRLDVNAELIVGDVNVGNIDVLSIAAGDNNIGNVDIASIAAGDNNIGNVDIASSVTLSVNSHAVTNAGTFAVQSTLQAGSAAIGKLAANDGVDIGNVDIPNLLSREDLPHVSSDYGVAAMTVRNDVLGSSATSTDEDYSVLKTDEKGALYTTHGITGLASDDNPTVGTSAEQLITDGADGATACKRVDIMAHPSNTGYIWVGDGAVSVDGLNGGIRLSPGDFYSMDIDNTGDVYAIATVDGENVCYNYFT